jgi:hypothetical protein
LGGLFSPNSKKTNMTFEQFSNSIELFGNVMRLLYQEKQNGLLQNVDLIAVLLSNEVYNNLFWQFEVQTQTLINQRKSILAGQLSDVQNYANNLATNGLTQTNIDDFEIYRYYDVTTEVINIYKLTYVLDYYKQMLDTTNPNGWVYDLGQYEQMTEGNYTYFVNETKQLFQNLI